MLSPRSREARNDPYDISQDADIKKETDRTSRRRQSRKKKNENEESMVIKMERSEIPEINDEIIITEAGDYKCTACPRSFKTSVGRQRHLKKCVSFRSGEGSCPCCHETLSTAHRIGEIACGECKGLFATDETLRRHIEVLHRGSNIFCCAVCPRIFFSKQQLVSHLSSHSDLKPWMCKRCNAVFTRKYHLDRHFRQSGCDGFPQESNTCQVCGREFSRKDNLREHLRAHAGINKRLTVYTCEFCNEVIAGLQNFNNHKRDLHVGNRPYKCSFCPNYFPTSGAMKKHQRTHTGERPYECRECFKKFAAKETLNRHMRTHLAIRPYLCTHCPKSYGQEQQLRNHLFTHTGLSDFVCTQCALYFPNKKKMDNHRRQVHEKADPLICEHCHRTYYQKKDIEKHMNTHFSEKSFSCEVCHKNFAQKPYLKVHMLTHSREPPRSCNYCNRAFIRQDCLLRHMRARHRDKIERILVEAERKKLQLQLLSMTGRDSSIPPSGPPAELAEALPASIAELLTILVDEDTLQSFGFPTVPVDQVLKMVIRRCGHTSVEDEELSELDRLRENAKLLFTVVIDDAGVKALLNNQSVDEVIQHVLNLVKS